VVRRESGVKSCGGMFDALVVLCGCCKPARGHTVRVPATNQGPIKSPEMASFFLLPVYPGWPGKGP